MVVVEGLEAPRIGPTQIEANWAFEDVSGVASIVLQRVEVVEAGKSKPKVNIFKRIPN